MSGLTKKIVYTDRTLATLCGVQEGTQVSYADISKGIHKYIKERNLKNPESVSQPKTSNQPQTLAPDQPTLTDQPRSRTPMCRDCGEQIPDGAVFCDMCGVIQ
jgi:chromatin remodeling complex protein RSC6